MLSQNWKVPPNPIEPGPNDLNSALFSVVAQFIVLFDDLQVYIIPCPYKLQKI